MPVDLTSEEKAKFEDHLKELGYDDHAKKVIERLNGEAKTHREAKEAADKKSAEYEAELKTFRDAEAARKSADDKKKADEDSKKKAEEDEKKSTKELIADLEAKFERELTKREEAAVKAQSQYLEELKSRDAQVLMLAVEAEAKERGIIDAELVKLLDVSKVAIQKGVPDREAIAALIEEHAKAKPHLYKSGDEKNVRTPSVARPNARDKIGNVIDASKLNDAEFDALTDRLRMGRV